MGTTYGGYFCRRGQGGGSGGGSSSGGLSVILNSGDTAVATPVPVPLAVPSGSLVSLICPWPSPSEVEP